MKLTRNQKLQLLALHQAAALSPATGAKAQDLTIGNVMVLGKLRDLGLADSRGVSRLGRRWTVYWLTETGIEEGRALAEAEAAKAA